MLNKNLEIISPLFPPTIAMSPNPHRPILMPVFLTQQSPKMF